MSKFRREFKNVVYNYTDAEVKVREATSNDPWGPSGSVMAELAEFTFHVQAYGLVMGMLWKRLNDHGRNWRHVYKALVVLEYLVKSGSDRVVQQCKDNLFSIETLKDFQFIDKDGKDNGQLVREKAKNLVTLLKDDQQLQDERSRALLARERNTALTGFGSNSTGATATRQTSQTTTPERSNHPLSVGDTASPTASFQPHIDQSRPNAKDEEDLQLQLALRMSKEQADEEDKLRKQEEESLKMALELSKQETVAETDEQQDQEESNTGVTDLIGLADPWAVPNDELPPSYDAVASQPKIDPWGGNQPATSIPDPFVKDPFLATTNDPWGGPTSSSPLGFGSDSFATTSSNQWTSFNTTPTTTTAPTTIDPIDIPSLPPLSLGGTLGANPYDFSGFAAPLESIQSTNDKPTVEESFLGSNAPLVNLDTLIAPLPPPTSINPFGITSIAPPTSRSTNPFEGAKQPAPTLAQLKMENSFDPLPPPLLPASQGPSSNNSFNPFS